MSDYDPKLLERARAVRLAVFDVDGVLTDGGLYFTEDGRELKRFHVHDGLGLKLLQECGVTVGVISSRTSPAVNQRMADLGIDHVYTGRSDKLATLNELLSALGRTAREACYTGDDWVDLGVMASVGLAVAVANADPLVLDRAHWVTPRPGGAGAARDVCRLLLTAQEKLDSLVAARFPT